MTLDNGIAASASVPSGASTGENEALELRDGDKKRYGGKGVLKAVANVNETIAPKLIGLDPARQAEIDRLMIDLDGTPNKSKLGANAILGVSMAVARAAAMAADLPLYAYLGGTGRGAAAGADDEHPQRRQARRQQRGFPGVHGHARRRAELRRGAALRGRDVPRPEEAFCTRRATPPASATKAASPPTSRATRKPARSSSRPSRPPATQPGKDIAIALDPAASSFYEDGAYNLAKSGQGKKTSAQMTALYKSWVEQVSTSSPSRTAWRKTTGTASAQHTAALGDKIQIVGDDLYVTNTKFIARGIKEKSTNAVLIKLNQIGSVTETIEAIQMCQKAGWGYVVSHRSGETEDAFLADFAVAMGGGQIKTGSACRSERIAKYNRLLEIEAELGKAAVFGH